MQIIRLDTQIQSEITLGALALGNFDGVHLGHAAVLNTAKSFSNDSNSLVGLVTFSPHPKGFFKGLKGEAFSQIFTDQENYNFFNASGMDYCFVKTFNEHLANMEPEAFLHELFEKIKFSCLVVGYDFKFGRNRSGNIKMLSGWCLQNKIKLIVCEQKSVDNKKISSSDIKKHLTQGDLDTVNKLLGRCYSVTGEVSAGQAVGRELGFPTLNINLDTSFLPRGVYFTKTKIQENTYKSISNLGVRPTVCESSKLVLENHILEDFSFDNKSKVSVEFFSFEREEKKFESFEDLKQQIQLDVSRARLYFKL